MSGGPPRLRSGEERDDAERDEGAECETASRQRCERWHRTTRETPGIDVAASIPGKALGPVRHAQLVGEDLTDPEQRVVKLIARGLTNKEIAETLALGPKTVEWRLTSVCRKLEVRSRTVLALHVARPHLSNLGDCPGLTNRVTN
jgi:DNA-binding NarL/FixJ family response regulator